MPTKLTLLVFAFLLGLSSIYAQTPMVVCQQDTLELVLDFEIEPGEEFVMDFSYSGTESNVLEQSWINGELVLEVYGQPEDIGDQSITAIATSTEDPDNQLIQTVEFEVLQDTLPPLVLTMPEGACEFQSLEEVSASSGFDYYDWSTGDTGEFTTVQGGVSFSLEAGLESGCYTSVDSYVQVWVWEPWSVPGPACPNESIIWSFEGELGEVYDYISWEGNWNGLGGEVVWWEGNTAEMTIGTYRVQLYDTNECIRTAVFNVPSATPYDGQSLTEEVLCDGLVPVTIDGDVANPESGLICFLYSDWSEATVDLIINGEFVEEFTSSSLFTMEVNAVYNGDQIELVFNSNGVDSEDFAFSVSNCGSSEELDGPFADGQVLVEFEVDCPFPDTGGFWQYLDGPGGIFEDESDPFTVFTPEDVGVHEFTFSDSICTLLHPYTVTIPQLDVLGDTSIYVCNVEDGWELAIPLDSTFNFIEWDNGILEAELTISEEGVFCATYEDVYGCGQYTYCAAVIGVAPRDPCDDGDPNTESDSINDQCECEGLPVGIVDFEDASLSIYPNPASQTITIQYSVFTIYNSIGEQVYASKRSGPIDISQWADGMYVVHSEHGAQTFIKQ